MRQSNFHSVLPWKRYFPLPTNDDNGWLRSLGFPSQCESCHYCTMGQNQVILRHQKFTFPRARFWAKWASERTSAAEDASEASSAEQANEWAVQASERTDERVVPIYSQQRSVYQNFLNIMPFVYCLGYLHLPNITAGDSSYCNSPTLKLFLNSFLLHFIALPPYQLVPTILISSLFPFSHTTS